MKVHIRDREALLAVSPAALSAYARAAGWKKTEAFGDHSDVYQATGLPEIILPRTQSLGDYANVVSRLIDIFAAVAEMDELALYRDLVTADRDVIRVRATEGDRAGTVSVNDGVNLMDGARDLLLAAACSLKDPRPIYRPGANKEASDYLDRVRLGQTEQGSFVVALLSPVVPPPMQGSLSAGWSSDDDPIERKVTKRLVGALRTTHEATESATRGDMGFFLDSVGNGVSANLCEALVKLVGPFPTLDIGVVWAQTRPTHTERDTVQFTEGDAPILREAARLLRAREPEPNVRLVGFVQRMKRDESEADGTIALRAHIDGQNQSVTAVLQHSDYGRAVQAHQAREPIIMEGDLERVGQRWKLLNARITEVIHDEA